MFKFKDLFRILEILNHFDNRISDEIRYNHNLVNTLMDRKLEKEFSTQYEVKDRGYWDTADVRVLVAAIIDYLDVEVKHQKKEAKTKFIPEKYWIEKRRKKKDKK